MAQSNAERVRKHRDRKAREAVKLTVEQFVEKYGGRQARSASGRVSVLDRAATRKALVKGEVPDEFRQELEDEILASGIPLSQTARGWGESGTEIPPELAHLG